jgi:hypothetical protein
MSGRGAEESTSPVSKRSSARLQENTAISKVQNKAEEGKVGGEKKGIDKESKCDFRPAKKAKGGAERERKNTR